MYHSCEALDLEKRNAVAIWNFCDLLYAIELPSFRCANTPLLRGNLSICQWLTPITGPMRAPEMAIGQDQR